MSERSESGNRPAGDRGELRVLRSANFEGVALAPGRHADQVEEACELLLGIPADALLWPFRVRKGLDAPGVPLRGWYGEGLFNNLGQFLTGYARLHAATGRRELADRAASLLRGWAETIDEDGFFLNSLGAGAKEYSFDKLVCGLLDLHEYLGLDEALPLLHRITVWMRRNGDPARPYAWSGFGPLEWYTLPEYLLRAYAVTGDPLYREVAESYRYDAFYDAVLTGDLDEVMRRADEAGNFYQAHSHLNTLNSAAAFYETTGDRTYLDAAAAGHDLIRGTQTFATGMFGPLEALMKPRQLIEVLHSEVGHAEISCPSWALMRLVRHLVELTGSARYGDWMELNVYNGIGAAPPTRADGRAVQYFADYGHTGARKTWGLEWTCCSATNLISMAEYANQIYYLGTDAVHTCLYLPSSAEFDFAGARLRLTQSGDFPVGDEVEFGLALDRTAHGTLGFRLPEWTTSAPVFTLNGEPVTAVPRDGWGTIERDWRDGDRLTVRFPMGLDVLPVEPDVSDSPVALRWGPVVLVQPEGPAPAPLSRTDLASVVATLRRTRADRLSFAGDTTDGRTVVLVPYSEMPPEAPYAMHFGDEADRIPVEGLACAPATAWQQVDAEEYLLTERRRYAVTEAPGASFEVAFAGTGVVWTGYRSPRAGFADVFVDGVPVGRVSQLARSSLQPFCWSHLGLAPGPHLLRVVLSADRPEGSRGQELNVKHIRIVH
ncbi:beta-L-arabinofuranosidase domain-containing protein [Actinomadura sp. WMMA1423]|uniref:beta-L-arabinofuranosidase domain-containing protein n=1 Tax=Actinomadura sp. WMMA1423 TaxID=2591108 RepID=UPI001146DCDB|nr:beta-L-arabinofuranosidase domain-containing protein [Actinomadura sp. WMMA1423]